MNDWLVALEYVMGHTKLADEIPWKDSPWKWWYDLKIGKIRGTAAEKWMIKWLTNRGLGVIGVRDPGVDLVVNGVCMEMKTASSTSPAQPLMWQQLRDDRYQYLLLLGIWPHECGLWIVPKGIAMTHSKPQHRGKHGAGDTRLLSQRNPHDSWLQAHGGSLEQGYEILVDIVGRGLRLSGEPR